MNAWSASSLEENNAAITRAAAELFYRQTNRQRDIRAMILSQKEILRDVKAHKARAEAVTEEMKSMAQAHTLESTKAASKISDLEKRLLDVEKEREIDLDKHVEFVKTLQARIAESGRAAEGGLGKGGDQLPGRRGQWPSRLYEGVHATGP